jgi:hypothetical protein
MVAGRQIRKMIETKANAPRVGAAFADLGGLADTLLPPAQD